MKLIRQKYILLFGIVIILVLGCSDKVEDPIGGPNLIFKFRFDPDQERLGNFGQVEVLPEGNAGQSPAFNQMGAHYVELAQKNDIPAYNGQTIFNGPTTTKGGEEAIDFDQALYAGDEEEFYSIPLANIAPGVYEYLRISVSYQNYSIDFRANGLDLTGTIASFVGQNTYIDSYKIKNETVSVGENKLQGYWAFETDFPSIPVIEGQAPVGATTVPNPIHDSSPIPPGSCLVTGKFDTAFEIVGDETEDITIVCSFSINDSFEWIDADENGTYDPLDGDQVINMGVRGLIPFIE